MRLAGLLRQRAVALMAGLVDQCPACERGVSDVQEKTRDPARHTRATDADATAGRDPGLLGDLLAVVAADLLGDIVGTQGTARMFVSDVDNVAHASRQAHSAKSLRAPHVGWPPEAACFIGKICSFRELREAMRKLERGVPCTVVHTRLVEWRMKRKKGRGA